MSFANIDTEPEPAKIRWSTSPSAAEGLRAKEGDLAEEGDVVQLGPGSDLVYLFRTFDGFLGASYIDGEWKDRQRALRLLDGSALKQPNGPLATRRFVDTEDNSVYYLLLFYNRGLPTAVHSNGTNPVSLPNAAWGSRNPYWLAAGWSDGVSNTTIVWSEPEVVLYSHTAADRIGYPDLFYAEAAASQQTTSDGRNQSLYMTETNKEVARLHVIDASLVAGLKHQRTNAQRPQRPDWISNASAGSGKKQTLPFTLPDLRLRQSVSFELWTAAGDDRPAPVLDCGGGGGAAAATSDRRLDSGGVRGARGGNASGAGVRLHMATHGNRTVVYAQFGDGQQNNGTVPPVGGAGPEATTRCVVDATRGRRLANSNAQQQQHQQSHGVLHHIGLVIDGAAKLALLTVDGVLCDGGDAREATQGFWFGLNSSMGSLAGHGGATSSSVCQVTDQQSAASRGDSTAGGMVGVRGYRRALRVSELVGSWKAGPWGPL